MSQPFHQHGVAAQEPERGVDLSRANGVREDTSLFHEIHDTIRRLFQHIVFVSLLTLRLYMLPLLYVSHKLATRDDPWYPASWNFILYPGRALSDCACCRVRDGKGILVETWTNVYNGFFARLRILKTLYSLGKIIGEDPNVLQPTQVPRLVDPPDSAIDVQSERHNSLKVFDTDSTDSPIEAPASASQIYHAALLNGNTLDDILAAFEAEEHKAVFRSEHILLHPNPKSPVSDDQQACLSQHEAHRYYNTSIQATPERMLTRQKIIESPVCCPEEADSINSQNQPKTPPKKASNSQVHVGFGRENEVQRLQTNPALSPSCLEHRVADVQASDKGVCSSPPKRCATFVHRHNQTRMGSRSLSSDKHSLGALQDRGTMSTPALGFGSPTKRAKLQRKVKVYQEAERPADI